MTAFGIAADTAVPELPHSTTSRLVPIDEIAPVPAFEPAYVSQERVLRGDTVAALMERLGVRDTQALRFLQSDITGRKLYRQLVPGRFLQAETRGEGELLALRYSLGPAASLEVIRGESGFIARERPIAEPARVFYRTASIRSSLFAATDSAGIPDAIALQIARVFGTDIDFHSDLRRGDRLSVVYEMIYESGELVGPGRILAAEFVNDGRTYVAVLFRDEEGQETYYSPDGSSRAKAFLRSPVEFSRVSSGFGMRLHPVFRNWRTHTGVDFAAPQGTRVLSVADGTVVGVGWRNGYGNTVEVRHGGAVTTLYAHLSGYARGVHVGSRVRQGDPIGHVGATGWATGPHLHYEFKVGGIHQDPMRVALPKATPVPPSLRPQFERVATEAAATLALVRTATDARFE